MTDEELTSVKTSLADLADETSRRFDSVWRRLDSLERKGPRPLLDDEDISQRFMQGVMIAVVIYMAWSVVAPMLSAKKEA